MSVPDLALPDFARGSVWLVGAGPGDPGLLTLLARHALERADVVLHDALVAPEILALKGARAWLETVGKRAGAGGPKQLRINQRLIDLARQGLRVLRLKGGDPFVFGRGGEEALALAAAGVPFRIVPGITSGIGGPAYAGIPVTHRMRAQSVAFVTGHAAGSGDPPAVDWPALAKGADTIVLYMGLARLDAIAQALLGAGRAPGRARRDPRRGHHAPPASPSDDPCPSGRGGSRRTRRRADPDRDRSGGQSQRDPEPLAADRARRHRRGRPTSHRPALNEAIMSGSSLPVLPESAPFPAEHIRALNSVMAQSSVEQRHWLSGFLAGYHAATAVPVAAASPAARAKIPVTILFGTESGNAEGVAAAAKKAAAKQGFAAKLLDMADTTPADVSEAANLLVIASTWGEGDPPERAVEFYHALMAEGAPRFEGVRFAVLALGEFELRQLLRDRPAARRAVWGARRRAHRGADRLRSRL